MNYGYARVSSVDQNADRQTHALLDAGVNDKNIFVDKASGATFDRPMYRQLFRKLKEEDVLYLNLHT